MAGSIRVPTSQALVTSADGSGVHAKGHQSQQGLRSSRRALTLIEILIAVSILLMVAMVVIPLTEATLSERRFLNTMDRVTGHLLAARLEAMERREPIEVVWSNGWFIARRFDPDFIEPVAMEDDGDDSQQPLLEQTMEGLDAATVIVSVKLPAGTRCQDSEPTAMETDGSVDEVDSASRFGVTPATSLRVAVFLPDGSVIERGPRWLIDPDGRMAALFVDRRTGLPSIQRRRSANTPPSSADQPLLERFDEPQAPRRATP